MRVTIGISFYNAEKTLEDAIRSVFTQSYTDWELILVNDGSTDRSLEIAKSVSDPRVRVVDHSDNKFLAHRLNEIADLAKGEYLARMDADDMMAPSRIEEQVRFVDSHKEYNLVQTGMCSIDPQGNSVGVRGCELYPPITGRVVLASNSVNHATLLARTAWFQRNKYDTKLKTAQDLESWCRAMSKDDFKVGHIPKPLYFVSETDSISIKKIMRGYRTQRAMLRQYGRQFGLSRLSVTKTLLKNYAKTAIQLGLSTVGLNYALSVRKRNASLDPEIEQQIDREIAAIQATVLPTHFLATDEQR